MCKTNDNILYGSFFHVLIYGINICHKIRTTVNLDGHKMLRRRIFKGKVKE